VARNVTQFSFNSIIIQGSNLSDSSLCDTFNLRNSSLRGFSVKEELPAPAVTGICLRPCFELPLQQPHATAPMASTSSAWRTPSDVGTSTMNFLMPVHALTGVFLSGGLPRNVPRNSRLHRFVVTEGTRRLVAMQFSWAQY